jgi:Uma2 family endonuclease
MGAVISFEDVFELPMSLQCLEEFRHWTYSDGFPDQARIDYVHGRIEVDMSSEDLFTHGTPKTEIARVLSNRVKAERYGHLLVDRTRISSVPADLSAEPDIVFISRQSLAAGEVRLVPKASAAPDRYVEIEGGPDLVVEIVSDNSETKDTQRLPKVYFAARVKEFWLVDVRGAAVNFQIHHRGPSGFQAVKPAEDEFQHSRVLQCHFRFERSRDQDGYWDYDLLLQGA